MALHPSHHRCNDYVENVSHFLRQCPLFVCTWRFLGYNSIVFFHELHTHSWLKKGLQLSNTLIFVAHLVYLESTEYDVSCNEQVSYHQLRRNVGSYLSPLLTSLASSVLSRPQQRWTSWHPSRMEATILNVDGSSFGSSAAQPL